MMNDAKIRIVPKDGVLVFNQGYSLIHTICTHHDDYVSTLLTTPQIPSNEAVFAIHYKSLIWLLGQINAAAPLINSQTTTPISIATSPLKEPLQISEHRMVWWVTPHVMHIMQFMQLMLHLG